MATSIRHSLAHVLGAVFISIGMQGCQSAPQKLVNSSAPTIEQLEQPAQLKRSDATQRMTGPRANAVRSAQQYLSISGFSRDGLIEQLSSDAGDRYNISDATSAVDSLNVDWNQQAARSAKQYLEIQGFSCDGLVEQLSSSAGNKYTVSQATFGAQQAGACN